MAKKPTLTESPQICMTAYTGAMHLGLKGWPEGLMTRSNWLDAGGPLDAPMSLPKGGAWSQPVHDMTVLGGSSYRDGAFA